ncbi:MAG: SDR family oxidoreductase [Caldilinea sp.]|jgi:NAD(P)-dependent dehydrogenase (short-subunit alcohol dehydrogenase family)
MNDPVLSTAPILERFRLNGRVALVTGGGQGIGRAFAHGLGEAGAALAVVDLRLDLAEEVAHELHQKQIDAIPLQCDVTRPDQVQAMVDTVVAHWGTLTLAFNNAGIGLWSDAETTPYTDWLRMIDVDLTSVFLCAQAEARIMLAAGYGKIVNTASMSAHISNTPQNQSAYNTAKAGVLHLTRSLAAEWAPRGVRVNSISPGYTRTKLVEDLLATPLGQTMLPTWMGMTPMRRMAEVTDLQGAAVYLSAPASDYMTGHDLVIDGGYCCW